MFPSQAAQLADALGENVCLRELQVQASSCFYVLFVFVYYCFRVSFVFLGAQLADALGENVCLRELQVQASILYIFLLCCSS